MIKTGLNWLNSRSIRLKVVAFSIVMSTVPLLLLGIYYYSNTKIDLENRILDKQELILKNLSTQIELSFHQTIQQLQMMSHLNEQADTNFYELLNQNESIEEIVVMGSNGNVENMVSRYNLNIPDPLHRWFTDEMWYEFQSSDYVIGEVEFNQFGQPVMKLAIGYQEDGKKKSIGVVIQLQKIIGKISSIKQEDSSYIYLLDRNRRVIAHQDYSKLWQLENKTKKVDVLGLEEEIPLLEWRLVMEQPKTVAYAPINEMFQNGLLVSSIITLIGSLISIYAGLYFTKPIVLLDQAMNRLRQSYKTVPITLKRKDELGKLSHSFNEMSAELEWKTFRIEQEKERLNAVVNGIGAGLALITNKYEVTWMNPILENWLEHKRVELPCYSLFSKKATPCEDCPITCPSLATHADSIIRMNQGNRERLYRHRVFPLNHAMEGEGEFLVVIEDVTDQKEMEEKITQTDKLSALGLMASSFAHEVNNPLASIQAYAEDLIDRMEQHDQELDEEEIHYYLTKIKENTNRCKQITNNLLGFSRKSNWTLSKIDIHETVQNTIYLVQYLIQKKRIQLTVSVQDQLPTLMGDSMKLMQVLVNLMQNSIYAVEEEGEIEISVVQEKDDIVFRVRDNGCGIPEEVKQQIFDPFFTTKPVGKGTGLGLSVCYGFIKEFGGNMQVESECGKGTTIIFHIPCQAGTRGMIE